MPMTFSINTGLLYFFCNRNEFKTTDTELIAIAAEAIIGFSLPRAATGMATML